MEREKRSVIRSNNKQGFVFSRKSKPKPGVAYNTYWKFAVERQNIFIKRLKGICQPWTTDKILNDHKFTNVYRATDRVSQYLIKNIIYKGDQEPVEVFFRILLFKIFNRISTWEFIEAELGQVSFKSYSFKCYDKLLSELFQQKFPFIQLLTLWLQGGLLSGMKENIKII